MPQKPGVKIGKQVVPVSKVNRYEYEGKVIEIPLRWDEHSKKEIEDYSLFIEQSPIYTPEGRPILLLLRTPVLMLKWWMMIPQVLTAVPASTSGSHAEMVDDDPASVDCGSCVYFRQPSGSILGVCHNEKMRCVSAKQRNTSSNKEETL